MKIATSFTTKFNKIAQFPIPLQGTTQQTKAPSSIQTPINPLCHLGLLFSHQLRKDCLISTPLFPMRVTETKIKTTQLLMIKETISKVKASTPIKYHSKTSPLSKSVQGQLFTRQIKFRGIWVW